MLLADQGYAVKSEPLTNDIIVEGALRCWDNYITREHEEALALDAVKHNERFAGKYPPNRLD